MKLRNTGWVLYIIKDKYDLHTYTHRSITWACLAMNKHETRHHIRTHVKQSWDKHETNILQPIKHPNIYSTIWYIYISLKTSPLWTTSCFFPCFQWHSSRKWSTPHWVGRSTECSRWSTLPWQSPATAIRWSCDAADAWRSISDDY
jgi:hypothetical protein